MKCRDMLWRPGTSMFEPTHVGCYDLANVRFEEEAAQLCAFAEAPAVCFAVRAGLNIPLVRSPPERT